jgi:nicotinamide mononucleotide transporter
MLSLEWLAAGLGLGGVVLGLRENVWVWPLFIASSAIYLGIYLGVDLIGQALLMFVFILTSAWGWRNWNRSNEAGVETPLLKPTWLAHRERVLWSLGALGIAFVLFMGFSALAHHPNPWLDATITSVSLIAMVLMGMKRIDCWFAWLFANAASVVLFVQQALWPTAVLYLIQFGLAFWGLHTWTRRQAL